MSGYETKGTQVRSDLPDAHQGYPVVTAVASSSRSVVSDGRDGSGGVRSDREDDIEKQLRDHGERVMIP